MGRRLGRSVDLPCAERGEREVFHIFRCALTDGVWRGHQCRDALVDGHALFDRRCVATDGAISFECADHLKAIVGLGLVRWRIALGAGGKQRRQGTVRR